MRVMSISNADQPFSFAVGGSGSEAERDAEFRQRLRAALRAELSKLSQHDLLELAAEAAEALDSLGSAYSGDPRDWAQYKRDAWTYGIVCGWGEDETEDGLPLVESIARGHGWRPDLTDRLRRHAAAIERITDHDDLWPERRRKLPE